MKNKAIIKNKRALQCYRAKHDVLDGTTPHKYLVKDN